jgi:hypothetical protein
MPPTINRLIFLLIPLMALLPAAIGRAQPRLIQVFLTRDAAASGADRLTFIDLISGAAAAHEADGERYLLLRDAVLYFDRPTRQAVLVYPDGRSAPHPFIQPRSATRRIDWILSSDGARIVWTMTDAAPAGLITTTEIANIDGTGRRLIFADAAREGIRAFPVALLDSQLIMDYQPDTLGDLTPFRQYASLFAIDLTTGDREPLPGEPGCFCGAGVSGRVFARMALASERPGYELRIIDLTTGARQTIPPPGLDSYTQGGDVLIAPDQTRLVYALAQVRNFGAPNQTVQTVIMLVDLTTGQQRPLTEPLAALMRPAAWLEDAVLFTTPAGGGTWRLDLNDGRLRPIASAIYLGTLSG